MAPQPSRRRDRRRAGKTAPATRRGESTRLERVLARAVADLTRDGAKFALVGGLAVSARAEPRFTRDVDVAVAVRRDSEAEALIFALQGQGYSLVALVEQEATGRLATARLLPPGESEEGAIVDFLFASAGVEREIVQSATLVRIHHSLTTKVATLGHLLAMKILSRDDEDRPQDRVDILSLMKKAKAADIAAARDLLRLLEKRGFHRGKDLQRELRAWAKRFS